MKKENLIEILLVLVCLSVLVVGCVPVAKYYVCSDGKQVRNIAECEPVVEETPQEVIPENTPEVKVVEDANGIISSEAKALMDKAAKVTAVRFIYFESDNPVQENIYYASPDKMKITLKSKAQFSPTESYDTVYYDFAGLTSFAYCENQDKSICTDRNKRFNVDFDQYYIKTPFDWMQELSSASLTGKSKQIGGRTAKEIAFEINGAQGTMFVDSFFGVPLSVSYGGKNYEYNNMEINEATEKDLSHQLMDNN